MDKERPTLNREWGWPQASTQMYGGGIKKFQVTNFDMKISQSLTLLMLGFPRVGDGSRTPPSMERVWIKFQITNFTTPNNVSSMI